MKTVIMAGGKGSRIAEMAPGLPKPMIPIQGKPILEWQIEVLHRYGLRDIIITIGHLGHVIKEHFAGQDITWFEETEPLGSGGALFQLLDQGLLSEDFLLVNGDLIFDMDLDLFYDAYKKSGAWALLASHPNSHPYDSALLVSDAPHPGAETSGSARPISQWLHKEDERLWYKNQVNAGVHLLSVELLRAAAPQLGLSTPPSRSDHPQVYKKVDLDREILKPLIPSGKLYAYPTPEYIKDAGTPERFAQVSQDLASGLVSGRNLKNKQKAVFIDRDGTINTDCGFVTRLEDFELIEGAASAIGAINRSGYLAIVITNQPVIARGECSLEELEEIHNKMETLLGQEGAFIDGLYFCPHHPDRGFPGERPEYKIDCLCRKPKPGMLLDAAAAFNIDLGASFMIGDHPRDAQAGLAAGVKPILVGGDSTEGSHGDRASQAEMQGVPVYGSLLEAVRAIL
ncbi:MAG: HAD-IIIA family hydrolase [Treponema sp.]|nr:HAD-IIIA family hydrolase [Treponema sp.]